MPIFCGREKSLRSWAEALDAWRSLLGDGGFVCGLHLGLWCGQLLDLHWLSRRSLFFLRVRDLALLTGSKATGVATMGAGPNLARGAREAASWFAWGYRLALLLQEERAPSRPILPPARPESPSLIHPPAVFSKLPIAREQRSLAGPQRR
jgi:hypothetical protein